MLALELSTHRPRKGECNVPMPQLGCGIPHNSWRALWVFMVSLISLNSSGCYTCQSIIQPYEYACCHSMHLTRARFMAHKLWRDKYEACYANRACAHDVQRGFVDGFVSVANGGNGCPPVTPNSRYCVGKFRPVDNCCEVGAWYEGFPFGAAAAEQHGCDRWFKLHLPPHVAKRAHPVGCPCAECVTPACQAPPCLCTTSDVLIEHGCVPQQYPTVSGEAAPVLESHDSNAARRVEPSPEFESDIPVIQPTSGGSRSPTNSEHESVIPGPVSDLELSLRLQNLELFGAEEGTSRPTRLGQAPTDSGSMMR